MWAVARQWLPYGMLMAKDNGFQTAAWLQPPYSRAAFRKLSKLAAKVDMGTALIVRDKKERRREVLEQPLGRQIWLSAPMH